VYVTLTQAGFLASGGFMTAAFPRCRAVTAIPINAGYSGGTARDFHPIPY